MRGNIPERGEGEQGSTRPKGGNHHLDVGVSRHEQVKLGTLALLSKDGGRLNSRVGGHRDDLLQDDCGRSSEDHAMTASTASRQADRQRRRTLSPWTRLRPLPDLLVVTPCRHGRGIPSGSRSGGVQTGCDVRPYPVAIDQVTVERRSHSSSRVGRPLPANHRHEQEVTTILALDRDSPAERQGSTRRLFRSHRRGVRVESGHHSAPSLELVRHHACPVPQW